MAEQVLQTRLVNAHHTAAEWASITTVPKAGEVCLETDTKKIKVGDGINQYKNLNYWLEIGEGQYVSALGNSEDATTITISGTYNTSGGPTSTTIPAATQSKAGALTAADKTKLDGIAAGAEVNVQSDWDQADTTKDDYIKNKPTLGTAAAKDTTTSVSSTSGANLPTEGAVMTAINSAISGVTQFDYQVVETLPASGVKGTIYLVAHSHGEKDIYDEYIWIGTTFEKIGTTDIDLSNYVQTSRKINNKALTSDITLTAADVSAVPTTRTVNGKALSSDVTLSAADVSAVPTTRTINGKALSGNINLTAADVGATDTTYTFAGAANGITVTPSGGTAATYELTSLSTDKLVQGTNTLILDGQIS